MSNEDLDHLYKLSLTPWWKWWKHEARSNAIRTLIAKVRMQQYQNVDRSATAYHVLTSIEKMLEKKC